MANELLTPFERQRLARNRRILSLYEEKRDEYPFISNHRIYKMISEKVHLTHDTIRSIVKNKGKEIPKRTQV